jgi:hypothetical protein
VGAFPLDAVAYGAGRSAALNLRVCPGASSCQSSRAPAWEFSAASETASATASTCNTRREKTLGSRDPLLLGINVCSGAQAVKSGV